MSACDAVRGSARGLGEAVRRRGMSSALIYVYRDVCYDRGARGGGCGAGRWLRHHQGKKRQIECNLQFKIFDLTT